MKSTLELGSDPFDALSFEEEIFDHESLFDFVHDWVFTYFDDGTEEFATI
jgi:hypothetical protein